MRLITETTQIHYISFTVEEAGKLLGELQHLDYSKLSIEILDFMSNLDTLINEASKNE